jgi:16S rRNA processing protein RimM
VVEVNLLEVGVVTRPHGIRGAVVVFSPLGEASALRNLASLYIGKDSHQVSPYSISEVSWMPRGWKIQLREILDCESAEKLRSCLVFADRNDLPELGLNEYYVADLVGFSVLGERDEIVGTFSEVESPPRKGMGHDLWVVNGSKTYAIPAVRHFIVGIDSATRTIRVKNLGELP